MNENNYKVDIVLATYNGSKYLPEQLNSIVSMDRFNELVNKVIICDDRSSDKTCEIVKKYIPDNKLVILYNELTKPYGPAKNFERGIAYSSAEYIMLCDQDDYWEKDKLDVYYQAAIKQDNTKPFIIFSDLEVVDSCLRTIDDSFMNYQSVDKKWHSDINNLFIQNIAPGCTMMFNREVKRLSLPFPDECLMHDWWIILVCKLFGDIIFLDDKTYIKYRQHGGNQVGAKKNNFFDSIFRFPNALKIAEKNYERTVIQMVNFRERYKNDIPLVSENYIDALSLILDPTSSRFNRVVMACKVNMHKSTCVKTFGTFFIIFKGLR